MIIPNSIIKSMFANVYFITGTAYAGKSTAVKLLSEHFDGICCGENFHDIFMKHIDRENQPNLSYFDTMKDWQEFVNRTPKQYADWIEGCGREAESLEIIRLLQLLPQKKPIFVDTNIPLDTLKEISDHDHVAVMICPQSMSVDRFFDRGDPEKQFILEQIRQSEDPNKTMQNYRKCLEKINSKEMYDAYANSGFFTLVRDDESTIEDTMDKLAKHFGL